MLFDSHAHIDDPRFDEDREEIIQAAKGAGLSYILNPGADLQSSEKAASLARQYEMVYAAVGVHPHDVKDMTEETMEALRRLSQQKKVVAIGEIGLDYYYDHSPRETQRYWFERQIQLAREVNLPIIIHDRDAHGEMFELLSQQEAGKLGCVMHCYSSSPELAAEYVKKGMYISLSGPITFKNSQKAREVAKIVPLEWLFVETDSPYLTPVPYRGKRNQPAYVKLVAEMVAEVKGITLEEVAYQTTENAKKFFRIE